MPRSTRQAIEEGIDLRTIEMRSYRALETRNCHRHMNLPGAPAKLDCDRMRRCLAAIQLLQQFKLAVAPQAGADMLGSRGSVQTLLDARPRQIGLGLAELRAEVCVPTAVWRLGREALPHPIAFEFRNNLFPSLDRMLQRCETSRRETRSLNDPFRRPWLVRVAPSDRCCLLWVKQRTRFFVFDHDHVPPAEHLFARDK